jgi:hypothetical protein
MRMSLFLIFMTAVFLVSCSSQRGSRNPASVETEKESTHEQFRGVFDRPM